MVHQEGYELAYHSDRDEWHRRVKTFVMSQLPNCWFCLGLLAHTRWFPPRLGYDEQYAQECRDVLRGILAWWPQIVERAHRFLPDIPGVEPRTPWDWGH